MEYLKKNAGPILYIAVSIFGLWFFYWFGAVVDHGSDAQPPAAGEQTKE